MAVISPGDLNNDSLPDLIVGAPRDDANSSAYSNNQNEGAAWVLLMGADIVTPRLAVNNDLTPLGQKPYLN